MKLEDLTEASYHAKDVDLERLLDTVAEVIPFIGWESVNSHEKEEKLSAAFKNFTGVDWHEWKKRS